jgi:predicted alpha/beta hydrolase
MQDWARKDAAAALDFARKQIPARKLLIVAHSFGGQAVGLMPNNDQIDAMLAVASQSGDYRLWPMMRRLKLMSLWYVLSPLAVTTFGYLPASIGIGEDLPPGVASDWARWCRTKGFFFTELPDARDSFARFRGPLHMISFSDDPFAPRRAAESLLQHYSGAIRTHEHISPADLQMKAIGHFAFFRDTFRDSLWTRALNWLDQQASR